VPQKAAPKGATALPKAGAKPKGERLDIAFAFAVAGSCRHPERSEGSRRIPSHNNPPILSTNTFQLLLLPLSSQKNQTFLTRGGLPSIAPCSLLSGSSGTRPCCIPTEVNPRVGAVGILPATKVNLRGAPTTFFAFFFGISRSS
jgi:hypothetical protein